MSQIRWGVARMMRAGAVALLALLLSGCGEQEAARAEAPAAPVALASERPPPLLLISLDGVRHDYLQLAHTPNLDALAQVGMQASGLVQTYPTKTFSTHFSLVTGRHAEGHGVVANAMWDPQRQERFSLGDRDAVMDPAWYDAEPIWRTAERQGLTAATFFWPGSEAPVGGARARYWKPYDSSVPHRERIAQVLAWLDLPADERPDLVTLYFSHVDSMGHRHGPESEQVIDAMEALDADLGRLFSGLRERDLFARMHILVVSDHGMAAVDLERYIALDEFIPLDRVRVSDWGPAAHIWAERISVEELEQRLQDAHPRLRVWRREQTPEHYRFRDHHRIADLIVEADLGWMVSSRRYMLAQRARPLGGMHGWDPLQRPMHGILLAHGPAFGEGRTPPVAGVHLYSLMAHLLDIEPAANDGDLDAWQPWLAGEYRTNAEPLPPPPVLYGDRYPQAPVADLAVPDLSQGRVSLRGDLVRQCRDDGERCRTRLQSGPDSVTLDLSGLGLDAPGEHLGAATVAGHWQPGGFRAHSLLLHAPGVLGHHGRTDNDND